MHFLLKTLIETDGVKVNWQGGEGHLEPFPKILLSNRNNSSLGIPMLAGGGGSMITDNRRLWVRGFSRSRGTSIASCG